MTKQVVALIEGISEPVIIDVNPNMPLQEGVVFSVVVQGVNQLFKIKSAKMHVRGTLKIDSKNSMGNPDIIYCVPIEVNAVLFTELNGQVYLLEKPKSYYTVGNILNLRDGHDNKVPCRVTNIFYNGTGLKLVVIF